MVSLLCYYYHQVGAKTSTHELAWGGGTLYLIPNRCVYSSIFILTSSDSLKIENDSLVIFFPQTTYKIKHIAKNFM